MKRDALGRLGLAVALAAALLRVNAVAAGASAASAPTPAQLLTQADEIHASDHPRFLAILQQLHKSEPQLTPAQRWRLAYLDAEQWVDAANYAEATPLLQKIIDHAGDPSLSARAIAELIEVEFLSRNYEHAYALANRLVASLPEVTDPAARQLALHQIAQMMNGVGQYDLALHYARQAKASFPSGKGLCVGSLDETQALAYANKLSLDSPEYQDTIDICLAAGQVTSANGLRLDLASLLVHYGRTKQAIALLHRIAPSIRASGYQFHIASLPVTLAQAYARQGDDAKARRYALEAIALIGADSTNWIVQAANEVLYRVAKRGGHDAAALAYYEKYTEQDRAAADDAKARALAYQEVRQEVLASQLKLDALGKQNQILRLRQSLAVQKSESNRLFIALLLFVIAFISAAMFWLLRSRGRFRWLARHDGLTEVLNRAHFLDEATRTLRRLRKLRAGVCLVVLDLDHFKRVNDTHGHAAGDVVLRQAVAIIRRELGDAGLLGRLGGEEFGILMPVAAREQGVVAAERIRGMLAATPIALDANVAISVSASFGLAYCADAGCSLRQLLIDADAALYRAKDGGRNQVVADDAAPACAGPGG